MKTTFRFLTALAVFMAVLLSSQVVFAAWNSVNQGNPILPSYFADPSIHKFGSTWYIYATRDGDVPIAPPTAWSTTDFRNWTMHTMSISSNPTDVWAPAVMFANNKYYMYYSKGVNGLFVADSSSPTGPWTERSLLSSGFEDIDPQPFQDTDGKVYLYWGNGTLRMRQLNADMISFADTLRTTVPANFEEGAYMIKRNGYYILTYSAGDYWQSSYQVRYAVSNSPYGPFTEGANSPILETNADDSIDGPGHHSLFSVGGVDYILYHRHVNPHGCCFAERQLAIDQITINTNGTINDVVPTHAGISGWGWRFDNNLARGKSATASSYENADFVPSGAVDDNNGTLWLATDGSKPQWLQVDLGANYSVSKTMLAFEHVVLWTKYKVEYSTNGTTWSTFADRTNLTTGKGLITDTHSPVTARYLRVTVTATEDSDHGAAIWEFKVFQ